MKKNKMAVPGKKLRSGLRRTLSMVFLLSKEEMDLLRAAADRKNVTRAEIFREMLSWLREKILTRTNGF